MTNAESAQAYFPYNLYCINDQLSNTAGDLFFVSQWKKACLKQPLKTYPAKKCETNIWNNA